MTAAVFTQIAEYFRKMHDDVVWPVVGPPQAVPKKRGQKPIPLPPSAPDKLAGVHFLLLKHYVKVVRLFNPVRPCSANDDCKNQGEICVNGECRLPDPGGDGRTDDRAFDLLQRCTFNDDCKNQGEICVDGFCVLNPFDLVVAPPTFVPDDGYYDGLKTSLFAYYARTQDVIAAGLGKDPSKVVGLRNVLMDMFADLSALAGTGGCINSACPPDYVCVNGFCVPHPYRLIFRSAHGPIAAPWM